MKKKKVHIYNASKEKALFFFSFLKEKREKLYVTNDVDLTDDADPGKVAGR